MSPSFQGYPRSWPDVTSLASRTPQNEVISQIGVCLKRPFLIDFLEGNMFLAKIWLHSPHPPLSYMLGNLVISASKWATANQCRSNLWGVRIVLTHWTSSVHEIWPVMSSDHQQQNNRILSPGTLVIARQPPYPDPSPTLVLWRRAPSSPSVTSSL